MSNHRGLISLNSRDSYYLEPIGGGVDPLHHTLLSAEELPIKGGNCGHSHHTAQSNHISDLLRPFNLRVSEPSVQQKWVEVMLLICPASILGYVFNEKTLNIGNISHPNHVSNPSFWPCGSQVGKTAFQSVTREAEVQISPILIFLLLATSKTLVKVSGQKQNKSKRLTQAGSGKQLESVIHWNDAIKSVEGIQNSEASSPPAVHLFALIAFSCQVGPCAAIIAHWEFSWQRFSERRGTERHQTSTTRWQLKYCVPSLTPCSDIIEMFPWSAACRHTLRPVEIRVWRVLGKKYNLQSPLCCF